MIFDGDINGGDNHDGDFDDHIGEADDDNRGSEEMAGLMKLLLEVAKRWQGVEVMKFLTKKEGR